MHLFLGVVGGVAFALILGVCVRHFQRDISRGRGRANAFAGIVLLLAATALVSVESVAAGLIAAAVTIACMWVYARKHKRKRKPDYVVDSSILKDSLSPRLVLELTELEAQVRTRSPLSTATTADVEATSRP
jgi:peptidoglycan/LPS O-acetylase OafA/YrhL